jgi:ligand-binding SRPBCC domain-containing protein
MFLRIGRSRTEPSPPKEPSPDSAGAVPELHGARFGEVPIPRRVGTPDSGRWPVNTPRAYRIEREQWIARPIREVFAFYGDATNLEAITPHWLHFSVITPSPIAMGAGTVIEYKLRWHVIPMRWTTLIEAWEPPYRFVDSQLRGPYRTWHHTHTFEERAGGTLVRDLVLYRLPMGRLGDLLHGLRIRRDLEAIFDGRARRIRELFGPLRHSARGAGPAE